jgi:hypothetical protein
LSGVRGPLGEASSHWTSQQGLTSDGLRAGPSDADVGDYQPPHPHITHEDAGTETVKSCPGEMHGDVEGDASHLMGPRLSAEDAFHPLRAAAPSLPASPTTRTTLDALPMPLPIVHSNEDAGGPGMASYGLESPASPDTPHVPSPLVIPPVRGPGDDALTSLPTSPPLVAEFGFGVTLVPPPGRGSAEYDAPDAAVYHPFGTAMGVSSPRPASNGAGVEDVLQPGRVRTGDGAAPPGRVADVVTPGSPDLLWASSRGGEAQRFVRTDAGVREADLGSAARVAAASRRISAAAGRVSPAPASARSVSAGPHTPAADAAPPLAPVGPAGPAGKHARTMSDVSGFSAAGGSPAMLVTPAGQPLQVWKLADLASAGDGTRGALSLEELLAMDSEASMPAVPASSSAASSRKTFATYFCLSVSVERHCC